MKKIYVILATALVLLAGCKNSDVTVTSESIFPDYSDIVIPCNIAPLNFMVKGADKVTVHVKGVADYSFSDRGETVTFPIKKWKSMLDAEQGNSLNVSVFINGEDTPLKEFEWHVSAHSIDKYLSYRLIEPAYEVWSRIEIEERNMENFSTRSIGDNRIADRSCMNCHTTNKQGTSFMHLRGEHGGTILNRDGVITKLNTKTEFTGNTVYGDISTDGRYGVFTTADIKFAIHSHYTQRMEVYDSSSDLVVVDFDNLTVTDAPSVKGVEYQETFPCFTPDGKTIIFCRAKHLPQPDSIRNMKYDIVAVQFDPETGKIGDKVYTVFSTEGKDLSFSHLKCSPDGRYLMATAASYGTFPVWHQESELWLIDLKTGTVDVMKDTNARYADTYHSWSSNSRWVVFASKRDDKVYGRPYIAYIDENGNASKAFLLPQKDPALYATTLKSFNLPELSSMKEDYNARDVSVLYRKIQPQQVTYKP
ncbi:MAG: PD40 domain-containing protein [Bacteroidaceae bacterium]|nr:PD40 domain-containing protein [Bacteroidaceae bacterium]